MAESDYNSAFRVLFLCTGKSGRSQMAATFAKTISPKAAEIVCAGDERWMIEPAAIQTMREIGLKLPARLEYAVEDVKSSYYDIVVTLCNQSAESCPTFPGSPARLHWPLDDPAKLTNGVPEEEIYRRVRDDIRERITGLFQHGFLEALMQVRMTFGSLLDNLTDGVMAHDLDRRIYFFNKAAERITGYSSKEVVGKDCHEVFPGRFCGGDCSFCEEPTEAHSRFRYPQTFIRRDSERRDLEMSVVTVNTPKQAIEGALIIFRDISEVNFMRKKLEESRSFHGIVGRHPSMLKVFANIEDMADVNVPILIQGESGTGKEVVATCLHQLSTRSSGPFVPVNCGALPEGTLESELFGHVKGAFTGAIRDKKGRFELAESGTIFLDEVGEISPTMQVKLLRVLQEKSFVPVGGEKSIHVDVRIICATNKNLKVLVQQGLFREDLFYRLAVVPLNLPPLRERASDIPLLIDHLLDKFSSETGKRVKEISSEAMDLLRKYRWPGNVRELINSIQYGMIKCQGSVLDISHLPPELVYEQTHSGHLGPGRPAKLDPDRVVEALQKTGGNKARAARLLDVSRTTLYRYLEKGNM